MLTRIVLVLCLSLFAGAASAQPVSDPPAEDATAMESSASTGGTAQAPAAKSDEEKTAHSKADFLGLLFVFVLATFIGLGVVARVSRLLHTPLMSLTNAISAIAVVGAIIVAGSEGYPLPIRLLGVVAVFASTTNLVSGFLITDRMLKMFKQTRPQEKQ